MAGLSLLAAQELRDQLVADGLVAVLDVRDVEGSSPCVLIPPPTWDDWSADGSPMFTWRLVAISGQGLGNLDAWTELDDLVTALAASLEITRAEPISYQLPGSTTPRPAYAVTYIGS